ncbi:DNA polymerase III subunit gamma/tau [Pasteurellaceae bacterium HPA106]|uniref:DNA polymerase III subunit gamma/tau n=1 Tax=Spirabiliibacterium pneumoniae TaxID=221400 RepID=UPI001AAD1586|nr:DNA polymerase III subunit gamma/tau [Spirabiliibacterium pneumoniae]MBE2895351.1 DNA polymerase III subunit gamma/tau [Spirabiliibacterium pneumoniae]
MSYQVLARKWRPQTFSQVVGQQHVLSALQNGLNTGRLHHAYLFSGTRGVGKTSIARLFAKGLNCETGITATPCGKCANCKAIEEGRFIDLLEIDAASRTKVEDTRDLLDNVQYKPVQGRFKIYLIDEVHMLSRHSFNALLKTLEEPPEYVKFLLATTDPQKLPITILSRCIQFHLKALDTEQISEHLGAILNQEKLAFDLTALEQLAKAAKGSIRDALSLTDQAIAMGNGEVRLATVQQMLGTLDDDQALDIIQALQLADGNTLMQAISAVAQKGIGWDQLLQQLASQLHLIAMRQLLKGEQTDDRIGFLAQHLPPEDVQFYYQLILTGRKELPFAPEPRSGVEMTLLRALAFHPSNWQVAPASKPTAAPDTASKIDAMREQLKTQSAVTKPQVVKPTVEHYDAVQSAVSEAVKETPTDELNAETSDTLSPALRAAAALKKLNQEEKKKPVAITEPAPASKVQAQTCGKVDLLERLNHLAQHTLAPEEPDQEVPTPDIQPESNDDEIGEDYHWQWLNPELESHDDNRLRPSEIKQAILQDYTPDVVAKVLQLSAERDKWAADVEALGMTGLSKQLALNALLLSHNATEIVLGLRSQFSHLQRDNYLEALQSKLQQYFSQPHLQLRVEICDDSDELTPIELRREVYQELSQSAKAALEQDDKLALLKEAFDATLELDSIRPVG